ncbi:MAG: hypothetical protein EOP22_01580 [Hyphomicrobiales bacterium]|nr:MAG: hypothetical protein EOP22_01580 [Hyphomicrobiales bacterium]
MREANVTTTAPAARALSTAFDELPRGEGETFVLVYSSDLRSPKGEAPQGFVPGYVATVWPKGYASSDWPFGQLPDGKQFSLVPLSPMEGDVPMVIDVLDSAFATFSVRLR